MELAPLLTPNFSTMEHTPLLTPNFSTMELAPLLTPIFKKYTPDARWEILILGGSGDHV